MFNALADMCHRRCRSPSEQTYRITRVSKMGAPSMDLSEDLSEEFHRNE